MRPVPEHLHTVTPHLVVADGAAVIAFYAWAFGAEEVGERFTGPSGELIHAKIRIGDGRAVVSAFSLPGGDSLRAIGQPVTTRIRSFLVHTRTDLVVGPADL